MKKNNKENEAAVPLFDTQFPNKAQQVVYFLLLIQTKFLTLINALTSLSLFIRLIYFSSLQGI